MDWTGLLATDEDLAVRAESDWPLLMERPVLAAGRDGVVASASPWDLSSASNDFAAQGVAAGCVAYLHGMPEATAPYARQVFGVESAAGGVLALRLLGGAAGQGMPPGGLGSLSGVLFRVATAHARIAATTVAIRRDLSLSDADLAALVDDDALREACVCKVLCDLYYDRARQVREASDAPLWAGKGKVYCARYAELVKELRPGVVDADDAAGAAAGDAGAEFAPMADTLTYPPTSFDPWAGPGPGPGARRPPGGGGW